MRERLGERDLQREWEMERERIKKTGSEGKREAQREKDFLPGTKHSNQQQTTTCALSGSSCNPSQSFESKNNQLDLDFTRSGSASPGAAAQCAKVFFLAKRRL